MHAEARDGGARAPSPWWSGRRGEWFVVAQVALIALVILGPQRWFGWPASPLPLRAARVGLAAALGIAGCGLFAAGVARLGANLTPLPYPRPGGTLEQRGAYAVVRHPLYGGGVLAALGWALYLGSVPTLVYAAALFVLLDAKARREERWLEARHPEYAAYRRRVRKLIPFLY